jgi:membrane protease YdiL (CAAX protease family)
MLSALLIFFIYKNRLPGKLGLCPSREHPRKMLYYLPLLLMLSANAWFGFKMNYKPIELVLYILSMICVGFLEEVIFRGLLFEAMRRESFRAAVIVSSVTFGIGHIINLFNGSGAELLSNLLQVVYATSAGFMFVMMYCKSGSLVGCIVAHALFNSLSAFSNDGATSPTFSIISSLALTLIAGLYALYLALTLKRE